MDRTLFLGEVVNNENVKHLIKKIYEINQFDDEQEEIVKDYEREPIRLLINTPGGSVYDGFALVNVIEQSKTPVYTICVGYAMSMGFMILASGHKRFAGRMSTLMYHEISSIHFGKGMEIKLQGEELERLQEIYDNYILENTNIIKQQLDDVKQSRWEWYITADEAVKLGVIDGIILEGLI